MLDCEAYERIGAPDCILDWVANGIKLKFLEKPAHFYYANRVKPEHTKFVDEQILHLLDVGAIRPCKVGEKPYCVHALKCVPKKNKKLRLIIDCRPLNHYLEIPKFSQS